MNWAWGLFIIFVLVVTSIVWVPLLFIVVAMISPFIVPLIGICVMLSVVLWILNRTIGEHRDDK